MTGEPIKTDRQLPPFSSSNFAYIHTERHGYTTPNKTKKKKRIYIKINRRIPFFFFRMLKNGTEYANLGKRGASEGEPTQLMSKYTWAISNACWFCVLFFSTRAIFVFFCSGKICNRAALRVDQKS